MDLSVIICSYNTRDLTLDCLRSFRAQPLKVSHEVIVTDNASTDGSAEAIAAEFPDYRLIRSERNLGFAEATNKAVIHARGDYLLLLNPDTIVLDNAIQKLYDFAASHSNYGICGGKTLYPDRSLNPTASFNDPTAWSLFCRGSGLSSLFRKSRLFNPEDLDWWSWDSVREVGMVTGCFLILKRGRWERLDGFDRDFFMYGEDVDLCHRSRALGQPCAVCPDAVIVHYGGASEKVRSDRMVKIFRAKAQTYKRDYTCIPFWYGALMLDYWAFSRMAALFFLSLAFRGKRESFLSWMEIWKRRNEWRTV